MRKIESNMNKAIRHAEDFRSSNTTVTHAINDAGQSEAYVHLHGNHLATISCTAITLFDGGWQSNTTKSRLNALCQEFAPYAFVFQKNWDWYVSQKGTHGKNIKSDFVDGFTLPIK